MRLAGFGLVWVDFLTDPGCPMAGLSWFSLPLAWYGFVLMGLAGFV